MPIYQTKIMLPEKVQAMLREFQGYGSFTINDATLHATFEFEAEDLFDATNLLRDVTQEAAANMGTYEAFDYERPNVVA